MTAEPTTDNEQKDPGFRRAVLLMTTTSFLVPLGGLVTAPIIARALGTDGRGEMAAALAPAALMLNVATIGLPDALTYFLAKRPSITRRALLWSSLATIVLGFAFLGVTWWALPFLSAGDSRLGELILFASACTIPALVVGVFRGAATGRQMWLTVAIERIVLTVLRVALFTAFWLFDILDVFAAVAISVAIPIVVGFVYLALLRRPPDDEDQDLGDERVVKPLLGYGMNVWFGSVASMLLNRLAPLLMVPLSTTVDLGLYTVASTIADTPLLVALAVQNTLFGVNSRTSDAKLVTDTSRLTLLLGFIGSALMAVTLPLWLAPLFGDEFADALWPTIMLLAAAVICIPSLMAASGLSAWGRPALRSLGLLLSVVVNVIAFVLTVPTWGVYGACWTSILTSAFMTAVMVGMASRVLGVSAWSFFAIGRADFARTWREVRLVLGRFRRRA